MSKKIRWGIMGLGKIAHTFVQDLKIVPQAQLVAVASNSLERAKIFATTYGAEFAFDSYEKIFSQTNLDVIYIATPHTMHYECTILCLKNGVSVLCEKPFAMNKSQVEEMVQLAQSKNLFLMEALWTRFLPTTEKLLSLVSKIGNIKHIQADFCFNAPIVPEQRIFNAKLGGGALLDVGIYPIFLSLLLLGMPSEVLASSIFSETNVDTTTNIVFKYEAVAMASLTASIVVKTPTVAHIYGELGYIKIHSRFHESQKISLHLNQSSVETFSFPRNHRGYLYEIEEVNRCLAEGKTESEKMPHSFSLKLIKLLDEVRQKASITYEV